MTFRFPTLTQMRARLRCTIIILPGSANWFPRQRMPPFLPHLVVLPHNFLGIIVVPMIALNTLSDMSRSEEACAARTRAGSSAQRHTADVAHHGIPYRSLVEINDLDVRRSPTRLSIQQQQRSYYLQPPSRLCDAHTFYHRL